jgi:hypothetical protein
MLDISPETHGTVQVNLFDFEVNCQEQGSDFPNRRCDQRLEMSIIHYRHPATNTGDSGGRLVRRSLVRVQEIGAGADGACEQLLVNSSHVMGGSHYIFFWLKWAFPAG